MIWLRPAMYYARANLCIAADDVDSDYLKTKWNVDLGTRGGFKRLVRVNARVGSLTQLYPTGLTLLCARAAIYMLDRVRRPLRSLAWTMLAWRTGYYRN
jgi:hypothetical protein